MRYRKHPASVVAYKKTNAVCKIHNHRVQFQNVVITQFIIFGLQNRWLVLSANNNIATLIVECIFDHYELLSVLLQENK